MNTNEYVTDRGFKKIEFNDLYNKKCSIQKSSIASQEAIWFGIDGDRMHLSREDVKELLPILERFVKKGDL